MLIRMHVFVRHDKKTNLSHIPGEIYAGQDNGWGDREERHRQDQDRETKGYWRQVKKRDEIDTGGERHKLKKMGREREDTGGCRETCWKRDSGESKTENEDYNSERNMRKREIRRAGAKE